MACEGLFKHISRQRERSPLIRSGGTWGNGWWSSTEEVEEDDGILATTVGKDDVAGGGDDSSGSTGLPAGESIVVKPSPLSCAPPRRGLAVPDGEDNDDDDEGENTGNDCAAAPLPSFGSA